MRQQWGKRQDVYSTLAPREKVLYWVGVVLGGLLVAAVILGAMM